MNGQLGCQLYALGVVGKAMSYLKPGDFWNRPYAWRLESGYVHSKSTTVMDVINFEADELGNNWIREDALRAATKRRLILGSISASRSLWVTRTKRTAEDYRSRGETTEAVKVITPPGTIVLTEDEDGALLLFKKELEYAH